jgi:excisionase family DNA binding protein
VNESNAAAAARAGGGSQRLGRTPESRFALRLEETTETPVLRSKSHECPVGPKEAAAFFKVARSTVLALARAGKIPAHPVTNGRRKRWLFFISELDDYVRGLGVNCGSHPCA